MSTAQVVDLNQSTGLSPGKKKRALVLTGARFYKSLIYD
jgi:hypothetical protein